MLEAPNTKRGFKRTLCCMVTVGISLGSKCRNKGQFYRKLGKTCLQREGVYEYHQKGPQLLGFN